MNIKKAYNFRKVNALVSCSGTLKNVTLQSLFDEGYEAVINLLPDENEYAVEGEKRKIEALGIQYDYIPVLWDQPQYSDFEVFESAMDANIGKKVHIHCAANFRASAFYAIYAYKNHNCSSTKLGEFIASIWQISDYPVWNKFVSYYANN